MVAGLAARVKSGILAIRLEDSDLLRRGRLLAAGLLILGAVFLAVALADLFTLFSPAEADGVQRRAAGMALAWDAGSAFAVALLFMLNRSGKVRLAAIIFVAASIAITALRFRGAELALSLPCYFVPIAMASFVLEPFSSLGAAAAALAAHLGSLAFAGGTLVPGFLLLAPAMGLFCSIGGHQLQNAITYGRGLLARADEDRKFLRDQVSRRLRTEYRLADSLREKDQLLREVHHRVKNNLQVIKSLVSLQATRSRGAKEDFDPLASRIEAMALVHELLYESDDFSSIDLREFAEKLFGSLASAMERRETALELEIAPIRIGIAKAVPIGLALNEALRNAFAHGDPASGKAVVRVSLRVSEGEGLALEVADNGRGLPDGVRGKTGLGLKIAEGLADQVDGQVELHHGQDGAVFTMRFRH